MGIENLLTPEELADAKRVEDADDELERLEEIANEADDDEGDDEARAEKDDDTGDKDAEDAEDDKGAGDAQASAGQDDESDESDEGDERPEFQTTFAPIYDAGDPRAIDQQLKAVRDKLAEAKAKWRSGDLDDEQYDQIEAELDERKDMLIQQRAQAVVASEMSQAAAVQAFARDKSNFMATMSRYEGVPYSTTPMLADAFERELKAIAQIAVNENRDPSAQDLFEAAHQNVLKQLAALGVTFGKKKAEQQEPKQTAGSKPSEQPSKSEAKPEGRPPADRSGVPPTLGGLPAAAPNTTAEDDLFAQAAQYEGEDLELFIAKLTPEKRRLLESAA